MGDVATLNIRNVPERVVETLKERAKAKGVSLNAEVVQTLSLAAKRQSVEQTLANIRRLQEGIPNPPSSDEIVERLRRDREERGEHVWREATRPRLGD